MWQHLKPESAAAPKGAVEFRRAERIACVVLPDGVWLGQLGQSLFVPRERAPDAPSRAQAVARSATGEQPLRAPMAGRLVEQPAQCGVHYTKGETLVVLEAMKMEYRIEAPADGKVTRVAAAIGDAVRLDAVLVTFVCDALG